MEEKMPERDYPVNFVRYGHGFLFYVFLLVYVSMSIGAVPEMIRTDPAFALGFVIGGPVIMKLITIYNHKVQGLYSVKLRYVFLPQVGVKAGPELYFLTVVLLTAAIGGSVYAYGFAGGYNENLMLPTLFAPYPVIGYLVEVNYFLNHGGVLPDKYMPF